MVDGLSLLEFVLLAIPVVLLAFALLQARRSSRSGGLKAQLAHVIADPRAGQRWLVALSVVLGAFLAVGALGAVALIWPVSNDVAEDLQLLSFVIGSISLALMLGVTPQRTSLSLGDELSLQEENPDVLGAVQGSVPALPSEPSAGMYIVPELPIGTGIVGGTEPPAAARP